jgi:hypothetical protein
MPDETAAEPTPVLTRGGVVRLSTASGGAVTEKDTTWVVTGWWQSEVADPSYVHLRLDTPADSTPAPEPLAAGVPVGSLPGEPGPGAYLIGDLLAVRWPGDDDDDRWRVQQPPDRNGEVGRWVEWDDIRDEHADKPMRRLLPRTEPARPAESLIQTMRRQLNEPYPAAETLTLDAIGDVFDNRLEAFIEKYDCDLSEAREDRDDYAAQLNAIGILANARHETETVAEAVRRTIDAFCQAVERLEKERDAATQDANQWREREHRLRKGMRVLLDPDEAQEPAQTPGGGDDE